MIRVYCGNNCNEKGIMPPQMNNPDKIVNIKAICLAGKYKDINIATWDPVLLEGIDTVKNITKTDVKYFLNEKEINEENLYIIYNHMYKGGFEKIDELNIINEYGFSDDIDLFSECTCCGK